MNDPELEAITAITRALSSLSEEQRRNVLVYVDTRYGRPVTGVQRSSAAEVAAGEVPGAYASVGDLFDAANPQSGADRVLVVGYWLQVIKQADNFEAFPVSKHLKHLGHSVTNITRALDWLKAQTPRLVLQISKSGSAKQARKRYKITREGIKRVESMLAQSNGDSNGN